MINKIKDIIQKLNKDTEAYEQGQPQMTEKEWNDLYFHLQKLEKETGIILPDSPTQKIHYTKVSALKERKHNHPMLSLDKTQSIDELKDFFSPHRYIGMAKMDGLTCSLTYRHGRLESAETRGDGVKGEDILHNALTIPSIPKVIPYTQEITIDGEVICKKDDFEPFANNYKNTRAFAAGSIRLLDNKECAARPLTFVAWDIINSDLLGIDTLSKKLDFLKEMLFTVVPYRVSDRPSSIEDIIWNLSEEAQVKNYPIDGIVFKFDNCEFFAAQGRTEHHFKGGIAYKFEDELYDTKLVDIQWTMGRTGTLTPVAIVEPIEIDGTTVERASMHNVSIMTDVLGDVPYVGQPIKIYKAKMIIPQIYSAEQITLQNSSNKQLIELPSHCPICGEQVVYQQDNLSTVCKCLNLQCEGQLINKLNHFCGKKGLDIKGLSSSTLEKLLSWGWINSCIDIFKLSSHKEEWVKKEGFGIKSVENILNAIENSKNCELHKFISSLGIPLIGEGNAKDLCKKYKSWNNFIQAILNKENFFELPNFGEAKHNALIDFDYTEAIQIAELLNIQNYEEVSSTNILQDIVFVITGKLNNYKNRAELKNLIESLGGKVVDSISSKTHCLINNDINSTSSKNKKAKSLNIRIISEEEFERMITQ